MIVNVRICRVGPGNFTPSLSQIPDVILSHHPARSIARRLPPSAESGAVEAAIRAALAKGDRGMRKIAADLGVGVGTVQRVAAELKAA